MIQGIYTAIVTPFDRTGRIDWETFDRLLDHQIKAGINGIVFCGTTGESPTLTKEEKKAIFEFGFKKLSDTRVLPVSGIGSNDTAETIRTGELAESIGFTNHLIVTPYYNKPTQAGLLAHYEKIDDSLRGNTILYNVPGRTGVSLSTETIGKLSVRPKIVAIKEATGNIGFGRDILKEVAKHGGKMDLISGDDATFLPLMEVGCVGAISVASHLFPEALVRMFSLQSKGQYAEAKKIHERLLPWFKDLFIESNPGPVKWALHRLGMIENTLRLPLVGVSNASAAHLEKLFSMDPTLGGEWK